MPIAFLAVHIDMCLHPAHYAAVPVWALWVRLALQVPLIAWAWVYTKETIALRGLET